MGRNQNGRIGALKIPQLRRRTEFYVFELLALTFGASAARVFFVHELSWQWLLSCLLGYVACFAMMVSVKCVHCREPLGRVNGKWGAFAEEICSRCGRDHG